jgi:hypothetical protein
MRIRPKNKITNKQFSEEIKKWAVVFGLKNFYFVRNDRTPYAACVGQMKDGKPFLEYSLRSINDYGRDYHSILFHEFGHIIFKHYLIRKTTLMLRVKKEYQAEAFSYKMMKKYFTNDAKAVAKRQIEMINDEQWGTMWPVHQEAFRRVYCK